eukprot:comp22944_c0_seq1/m.36378 comp22944_c0_seq1/g.36378  ORF comp22944_c0_seq1/g.36378 comp22944_c0_seq1/m.36378 type:complete len:235 (-) comp22944_c0_seq1:278-982(-)
MALRVCACAAQRLAATPLLAASTQRWARHASTKASAQDDVSALAQRLGSPAYVPRRELGQALTDYLAAMDSPQHLDTLQGTLRVVQHKGLKLQPETSLEVLSACLRVGGEAGLGAVVSVFGSRVGLPVDNTVLRRLVGALANRQRPDLAWQLFNARAPATKAGLGVHKKLLGTGAGSKELYARALDLYHSMLQAGPYPDQEAYQLVLGAATAHGDTSTVEAVRAQAQRAGYTLQ